MAEDATVPGVVKQVFGVPLHSHQPLSAGVFDGLHKQVVVYGRHSEILSKALDGLAVNAVGANHVAVHQASQTAVPDQANRLEG